LTTKPLLNDQVSGRIWNGSRPFSGVSVTVALIPAGVSPRYSGREAAQKLRQRLRVFSASHFQPMTLERDRFR
jgi:hypothetical protein